MMDSDTTLSNHEQSRRAAADAEHTPDSYSTSLAGNNNSCNNNHDHQAAERSLSASLESTATTTMTTTSSMASTAADGCSATAIRATRRLRIMVTFVMALVVFGITLFGSSTAIGKEHERSITKRSSTSTDSNTLFDVNAPPGLEERTYRKQASFRLTDADDTANKQDHEDQSATNSSKDEEKLAFPVIQADDDEVPTMEEKTVDALECRESVINFVINATDAKDECNGLKKAFDMTCNTDSAEEIRAASADPEHPPADGQNRRLLDTNREKSKRPPGLALLFYQMTLSLKDFVRGHFAHNSDQEMFFPEDAILGSAWEEAKYQVQNEYDVQVHESLRRRLQTYSQTQYVERTRMRFLEESSKPLPQVNVTTNQTSVAKPPDKKVSLSMPTNKLHASEKMLGDTLMLGKEKDIQAAIKASSNQTNVTLSAAQEDAVASSKAVHDTAAAVSAVLNDPESVEARTCCASILNVYHEHCDATESNELSDSNLFVIVFIIAFCGVVKSLIRHFKIRWLPEAAGCILVGVLFGCVMSFIPHYDLSFDGDWFLRIMVPPIVFEAALSIDKRSFQKHLVPILVYAIIGTLFSSAVTALIVHKGTSMLGCETIPYVESLTFGALISSIDPIAVLSVLSNVGMNDTDAIYVIIFGESLLNDGIAMVLFQTLVHFMDTSLVIDQDAFVAASMHFLVVALGSVMVGLVSGMACTCYFYAMKGCQTPLVEVLVFFCWAFLPYYICDGVEWSGIVAIVTTGIVMDLYVVGQDKSEEGGMPSITQGASSVENVSQKKWDRNTLFRRMFSKKGQLSAVARTHVGFVTEILSTMMETAIFSYLGFFLFSYRYHWNFWHVTVALLACCVSRAVMIPTLSLLANWITSIQQSRNCRTAVNQLRRGSANEAGVTIGARMQMVLWFAGLRGAMSFALVENIPLYDAVTGEGSRMKAELKAMTSACIIFTVFVMGGCTDYVIERLGMAKTKQPADEHHQVEMSSLLSRANGRTSPKEATVSEGISAIDSPKQAMFRQRGNSRI